MENNVLSDIQSAGFLDEDTVTAAAAATLFIKDVTACVDNKQLCAALFVCWSFFPRGFWLGWSQVAFAQ